MPASKSGSKKPSKGSSQEASSNEKNSTTSKDTDKETVKTSNSRTALIVLSILIGAAGIAFAIIVQSDSATSPVDPSAFLPLPIQEALNNMGLSSLPFDQLFPNTTGSFVSSSFREKWEEVQVAVASHFQDVTGSSSNRTSVGQRMAREGFQARHPVFMIPGFVTSGLELWAGEQCAAAYFRRKIWGSLETFRSFASDQECWKKHLSLDPETGMDPPNIRLRSSQGFEAADFWTGAFWVWDRIIRNLADVGYDGSSMSMEGFDWRVDFPLVEQRDGHFSKLKRKIEAFVEHSNEKAVLIGHSMGAQHVFFFLVWVVKPKEEGGGGGGSDWVEKYIHAYVDLSGPMMGLPKAASALLSGEMKDTNMMPMFGGLLENFFGRKRRQELFATWGSLWGMLPKGGDSIWGPAADVDCGDGAVPSGTDCVLKNENGGPTPNIPFLTFTDEECPNYEDPLFSKFGSKPAWSFDDVIQYLSEWKSEYQGTRAIVEAWNDPTIHPLPHAPSLNIYCMYGVGLPTSRMYHYRRQNASENDVPFIMDNEINNETKRIIIGIKMVDGDGSVPLLSLGYTCAELWKEDSDMNPGKSRVVTREYKHEGSFQIDDPMRQGPLSGEHCDILGNHGVLEDLIKIAAGDSVEPRIVSKIEEIAKKIREHPINAQEKNNGDGERDGEHVDGNNDSSNDKDEL